MLDTSAENGSNRRVAALSELVSINSVNPAQAGDRSGPGGERVLAEWLAERTSELGASVILDDVQPNRPNVYAEFPGPGDRTLAVDVHLDTVGVEHMEGDPFHGRVADGRVYGRGSVDTKATFAVLLPILEDVASGIFELDATLLLVGTVGEEAGGLTGAFRFKEWLQEQRRRLDGVIVAEPTNCRPVNGHKGGLGLEITVRGQAVHSSKPELGANAISAGARVATALQAESDRLEEGSPSAMGTGTICVTEIAGGRARNIVPDECRIYADRRLVLGEDPESTYAELRALVASAAAPLSVEIELAYGRWTSAFYTPPESAIVTQIAEASGAEPELATYGTNALAYGDDIDQLVVFGPGSIDQAHQAVEWVEVSELDRADDVYRSWLGRWTNK